MFEYTVRRVLLALGTLLGITVVTFGFVNLAPGDPAALQANASEDPKVSARIYETLRKHFELDRPIHERYLRWLGRMVTGDFGTSMQPAQRPVGEMIRERIPWTLSLSLLSILLGFAMAIPIGVASAARARGWFDRVSGVTLYALYAVPSYVMAILLIYFVSVRWDLLPFLGNKSDGFDDMSLAGKTWDLARHFVLITVCYTYGTIAYDARFVRQNLLEVLRQDYVRTARAKGLSERTVVYRHAFRNTLIPLVTRLGLLLPALLGGSVILESIFNWPGIGKLFLEGVLSRDYTLVMALSFISASLVLLGSLLSDLAYALVDPRISYA